MFCHIVSRVHIHNTLVFISTDTPRPNNVVCTYYYTIIYVTSKCCSVAINEYKCEYRHTIYFKIAVVIIVLSTAVTYCCSLFYIYQTFIFFIRIITLFQYSLLFHFSKLINTKVSGYFDLTNTTTHVKYHSLNRVLHLISIKP